MELSLKDLIKRWIRLSNRRFSHLFVQRGCRLQGQFLFFLDFWGHPFLQALFRLFPQASQTLYHVFFQGCHVYSFFPFFVSFLLLFLFPFFIYVFQIKVWTVQAISIHQLFSSIFPVFIFPIITFQPFAILISFFSFLLCAQSFILPSLFFSLHTLSFVIRSILLQIICLHPVLMVFSFIVDFYDLLRVIFLHVFPLFKVFDLFLLLWDLQLQVFSILYSILIFPQDVKVWVYHSFGPNFCLFDFFDCLLEIVQGLQCLNPPKLSLLVAIFEDAISVHSCHLSSFLQLDPSYLQEKSRHH